MDLDTFLAANQPTWDRLAELTRRAGRKADRLTPSELEELVRLYQRVSSHLSYARTYLGEPGLIARLTGLVATAGSVVYGTRAKTWRTIGRFFTTTYPAAVYHARWFMAASALLFLVPAAVMGLWLGSSDRALNAAAPEALSLPAADTPVRARAERPPLRRDRARCPRGAARDRPPPDRAVRSP